MNCSGISLALTKTWRWTHFEMNILFRLNNNNKNIQHGSWLRPPLMSDCFLSRISGSETWLYVGGAEFVPCWFLKYLLCTCCCYVCSSQRELSKFRRSFSWSLKTNWKSVYLNIFKRNEHFFFFWNALPVICALNWAKATEGSLTRQSDFGYLLKWLWRPT